METDRETDTQEVLMSMFLSCSCLPPEESLLEYTRNRHKPKRYEDRFINRMLSSLSARSKDFENDHSRTANKDMMRDRFRKSRIRKQVCFDYPPITSYHTRPRTASNERPDLFYTEDELDEIAADCALLVDDVEVTMIESKEIPPSSTTLSTLQDNYDNHSENTVTSSVLRESNISSEFSASCSSRSISNTYNAVEIIASNIPRAHD